jgi:hypothetical protein
MMEAAMPIDLSGSASTIAVMAVAAPVLAEKVRRYTADARRGRRAPQPPVEAENDNK